jgi:hypothetical protein
MREELKDEDKKEIFRLKFNGIFTTPYIFVYSQHLFRYRFFSTQKSLRKIEYSLHDVEVNCYDR